MPICQKKTAKPTSQQSDALREAQSKGFCVTAWRRIRHNRVTYGCHASDSRLVFSTEFSHVHIDLKLNAAANGGKATIFCKTA